MGEFSFSFALQCAIAVEAEAEAEAVEHAMRRRGRDWARRREGFGCGGRGGQVSVFSSRRRRCSDDRDLGVEVGVGEFPFSVALQGAIDRGRGAGRGWASFLSLSPFKARSIAV